MAEAVPVFGERMPSIRKIEIDRPWSWLAAGWGDLRKAPSVGLGYGALLAALGLLLAALIYFTGLFHLILPLTAGFMLMGPILAVGLYETSRRLGTGEPAGMAQALTAWTRNFSQVAFLGFALMFFLLAWIRLATLIFALFYGSTPINPDNFIVEVFFSLDALPFLATGTIVGGVLAVIVFAISAISVPMLMDRDVSIVVAIVTSVAAVKENPAPMLLWAVLIALFTGAGLATGYLGLIVTLPLIGHATWHAYKDLVSYDD
jgi:uncharacterized membrane protein